MLKEFQEFIAKGNVMDLAVGVIIGGAFAKITTSLVNDVLMPILSLVLVGGVKGQLILRKAKLAADGSVLQEAAVLNYGQFITTVLDFLLIGFVIFLIVKAANKLRLRGEE
ncbi:MAG: large conductance mechanosensitive channel protein MscL [Spirosomataceae bacterium]